jgi:hypothetical protein
VVQRSSRRCPDPGKRASGHLWANAAPPLSPIDAVVCHPTGKTGQSPRVVGTAYPIGAAGAHCIIPVRPDLSRSGRFSLFAGRFLRRRAKRRHDARCLAAGSRTPRPRYGQKDHSAAAENSPTDLAQNNDGAPRHIGVLNKFVPYPFEKTLYALREVTG